MPDILWLSDPSMGSILDMTDAERFIYRIGDNYAHFPTSPKSLKRIHESLIQRADVVVSSSRGQLNFAQKVGCKQSVYLPNGADVEAFLRDHPEPLSYVGLPHPRVVYVGTVDDWFDYDLMERVATALYDYTFVMVGPVRGVEWKRLGPLPNTFFLGPRPYADIPAYMQWADVLIIPFRRTPLVEDVSPIKLFEYLATGNPVVATEWQELKVLRPPCTIVASKEEFESAIVREATSPTFRRDEMIEFARSNSWSVRFNSLRASIGWS